MRRVLTLLVAVVLAVLVEGAFLVALTQVVGVDRAGAFTISFAAGYVTLVSCVSVMSPAGSRAPLVGLRKHALTGLAALVVMQAVVYVCDGLMGATLVTTNAAALVVVACWLALERRITNLDARRS